MGRPSKYESEVKPRLLEIEAWARDGLTLDQIAHNLGIALSTLCEYKNQYTELAEALKRGKEVVDIEVENALFKAATGYYYEEETVTNSGRKVTVRKYEKPNTTAMIFWLKNRKREAWRDKQDVEHTGENGGPMQVLFNIPRPKKDES
jgi:transposase